MESNLYEVLELQVPLTHEKKFSTEYHVEQKKRNGIPYTRPIDIIGVLESAASQIRLRGLQMATPLTPCQSQ